MQIPDQIHPKLPNRLPYSLGFSLYSLRFDRAEAEDYISVPGDPDFTTNGVTVACWMKSSITDTMYFFGRVGEINLRTDASGNIWFSINDGTGWYGSGAGPVVTDGRLHFVAGTYDGSDIKVFTEDGLGNSNHYVSSIQDTTNALTIGQINDANWFGGELNEPIIYTVPLSWGELMHNMLNYHDVLRDGLYAWYRLEEGEGTTAFDFSGNDNDGTLEPAADPPEWIKSLKWELRSEVGL